MYCRNCGKEISPGAKFCEECGTPVNEPVKREEVDQVPPKEEKPAKGKKPFYKRWWFWVIVAIVLLAGFGGSSDSSKSTTSTAETAAATAVTEKPELETKASIAETEETTEATAASNSAGIDTAVGLIESVLKENFENYTISHEDDIITISVWEDGIAMGAVLAAAGNEEYKASWDTLVENEKGLCKSVCDFVDTMGLDDVLVVVNLLNDGNKNNVLLSVAEGIVIYDSVNEIDLT